MRITPHIWFDGTALEAAEFYAGVFREAAVTKIVTYPEDGLPDFQTHMAGRPLTVDVEIHGRRLSLINAGPEFRPNHSISFLLNFDPSQYDGGVDEAIVYLDSVHDALVDGGGGVMMELGEYPHSARYAWIRDRFGVTWQLMLTNPSGEDRPFLTPSFMFGGANQDTTFNEGISLLVEAEPGAELDRLWNELSSDPAAEQCGWCKDRFGVSWQVVPENMDELMTRPGAYGTLMGMKKIEAEEF